MARGLRLTNPPVQVAPAGSYPSIVQSTITTNANYLTAVQKSPPGARGVLIALVLNTAGSSGNGIQLWFEAIDPISGNTMSPAAGTPAQYNVGTWGYLVYPSTIASASGDIILTYEFPLPQQWLISVTFYGTPPPMEHSINCQYLF